MTTLKKLNNHKKIDLAEWEEDGLFVYTAPGWRWSEDCCHTRSFDTIKEAFEDLILISECSGVEHCCISLLNS